MNYWAVIPAAGVGRRMASTTPKQYLTLCGKPVLQHTLERFAGCRFIKGVLVALHESDEHWKGLECQHSNKIHTVPGGDERCHSVKHALDALLHVASEDDWVMVHDAVRPCVTEADIVQLINRVGEHPVGGVLGVPASDTVKQVDQNHQAIETVPRECLWLAYTPQMFRLGVLHHALTKSIEDGYEVTDESSALEHLGYKPMMVQGHKTNIKITTPEDLKYAEWILSDATR